MTKLFVIVDLTCHWYHGGNEISWTDMIELAYKVASIEEAERIINQLEDGYYTIVTVYL